MFLFYVCLLDVTIGMSTQFLYQYIAGTHIFIFHFSLTNRNINGIIKPNIGRCTCIPIKKCKKKKNSPDYIQRKNVPKLLTEILIVKSCKINI